jgi:predicted Zn-dependent peptidase
MKNVLAAAVLLVTTVADAPSYAVPDVAKLTLQNGVDVLFVEQHDLPIVRVDVVLPIGWADLPDRPAVVLEAMGELLERGTATRSSLEIASAYVALGAEHGILVKLESVRASVKVLASKLEPALDLLQDVVLHPSFPQAEIDLVKGQRLDAIREQMLDAESISWNALEMALYGPRHPYARASIPTPQEVAGIDGKALRRTHARVLAAQHVAIVVVGDATPKILMPELERAFGGWQRRPRTAPPIPPPPPRSGPRIALVDRPGLLQSFVYVAEPAISWSSPDRETFALVNMILGEFWMNRWNADLRERRGVGPFRAGGATQVDKTGEAVAELLHEIRRMTEAEPEVDALEGAKQVLLRGIVSRFETTTSAAESVDLLVEYGLPLDEFARWRGRVEVVSASDVQKTARRYLHPETMKIIVVGDRAKVEPQLASLRMGRIELRGVDGRLLRGPPCK